MGLGCEGLMSRHSEALYRPGRRSMVDQELMKVKRTEDSEAVYAIYRDNRSSNPSGILGISIYPRRKSDEQGGGV